MRELSIKELKKTALEKLEKNWMSTLQINLILCVLAIFIQIPLRLLSDKDLLDEGIISGRVFVIATFLYLVYNIIKAPIHYGIKAFYLNISRGLGGRVKDLFSGYKQFFPIFKLLFLQTFFVILWSFLFIIPGVIKACSYSQALRLKKDNPDMKALDCITESRKIMDGYKMGCFILNLSFIGWCLLIPLTFGMLGFWLYPYIEVSNAEFYEKLKLIKYGSNDSLEKIKEIEREIGEEF